MSVRVCVLCACTVCDSFLFVSSDYVLSYIFFTKLFVAHDISPDYHVTRFLLHVRRCPDDVVSLVTCTPIWLRSTSELDV